MQSFDFSFSESMCTVQHRGRHFVSIYNRLLILALGSSAVPAGLLDGDHFICDEPLGNSSQQGAPYSLLKV